MSFLVSVSSETPHATIAAVVIVGVRLTDFFSELRDSPQVGDQSKSVQVGSSIDRWESATVGQDADGVMRIEDVVTAKLESIDDVWSLSRSYRNCEEIMSSEVIADTLFQVFIVAEEVNEVVCGNVEIPVLIDQIVDQRRAENRIGGDEFVDVVETRPFNVTRP